MMTVLLESRCWILNQHPGKRFSLHLCKDCSSLHHLAFCVENCIICKTISHQPSWRRLSRMSLDNLNIVTLLRRSTFCSSQHPAGAALMSTNLICPGKSREPSQWRSQAACRFHYKQLLPPIVCSPTVQQGWKSME